jgi:alkaline phosphatase D
MSSHAVTALKTTSINDKLKWLPHLLVMVISLCCSVPAAAQCDTLPFPFRHGVASGDATQHEVILWTRLSVPYFLTSAEVQWYVASDNDFSQVLYSGVVATNIGRDFTVKIDVTGLTPGTWYYYRFSFDGVESDIGRTHTLPDHPERFCFAAFSCSNYEAGFFNGYRDAATRNDLQAVIHLGDYYYEYGGSSGVGRVVDPPFTAYTLDHYRRRHAQVAADKNAQLLRRQLPWYTLWDDHEFADDSWVGGANGHLASMGLWEDRKQAAKQAYFEWMPIRENNDGSINRRFSIPGMANMIFMDSRMQGRVQQVPAASAEVNDSQRTILGVEQFEWVKNELLQSDSGTWRLMFNSVMMNRAVSLAGYPIDADLWEGYRPERDSLLRFIATEGIDNVVSYAGDYHSSWAGELPLANYNDSADTGSAGVEFVVCALTSSPHTVGDIATFQQINPHIHWIEQSSNGYLIASIDNASCTSQWIYTSTIASTEFNTIPGELIRVDKGNPFLYFPEEEMVLSQNPVPLVTDPPLRLFIFAPIELYEWHYPNPVNDVLHVAFNTLCGPIELRVYNACGQQVEKFTIQPEPVEVRYVDINTSAYASGVYIIEMVQGGLRVVRRFVVVGW